ncbi:hypothetical protein EUX98_g4001 [Antrodiella citrinella]|uniref:Formamidopyrimidine-DNA glycosylase catalytic domain-containing protein n=1 Tax=Antrodiella citrinella TaxID=2447956 RepID=A0A4V3XIR2_9APHY|nr:hypothetical protein EUX98_g4001 [Antrodiella citrinella]
MLTFFKVQMPELPEVERAKELVRTVATGKTISRVDTTEDTIVFSGISHTDFAKELTGRKVRDVSRYGKVFFLVSFRFMHCLIVMFAIYLSAQVKGQKLIHYREAPRKMTDEWPPKFMKFVLHIQGHPSEDTIQLAFMDARRLGRIRLCASPLTEPPISALGFDPILSMPDVEAFKKSVLKRSCPIKALLLDQSFSAGVGNWVADEILYHARIHPERRCNTLQEDELLALHDKTQYVCRTAVAVNADDTKFPSNWLFKHRWVYMGKGKKKHTLTLPSEEPATIKFITVGGRTSAYIVELQKLSGYVNAELPENDSESDLTPLEEEETVEVKVQTRTKRKGKQTKVVAQETTKKRCTSKKEPTPHEPS